MRFTRRQQGQYLEHVRNGMRRGHAADALRLDRRQVRQFIREHSDFEEAVLDAEEDAAEQVEQSLWEAAVSGNTGAAAKWLELSGRQIGRPRVASTASEPEVDPLADLPANVEPLDPRRRAG